jgi:protein-tyrosine phosphatase
MLQEKEINIDSINTAGLFSPGNMHPLGLRVIGLVNGCFGTYRGLVRMLLGEAEFLIGRLDSVLSPDLTKTKRLVFVCLGNINRSAFAEKLATDMGLTAISIGLATSTGAPAFSTAVVTASRFGINLSTHEATDIGNYNYIDGDLLMAMEVRHAHQLEKYGIPTKAITLLGHWASPHRIHIHDPHTLSNAYFRTCFSVIHSAVRELAIDCQEKGSPCLKS